MVRTATPTSSAARSGVTTQSNFRRNITVGLQSLADAEGQRSLWQRLARSLVIASGQGANVIAPGVEDLARLLVKALTEYQERRQAPQSEAPPPPEVVDPENPDAWIGLDHIHEQISNKLKEQSDLWETADSRLRLILGVISVVFAVALGLLPRGSTTVMTSSGVSTEPLYLAPLVGTLIVVGLIAYFAAGVVALRAYWPRDFDWPPKPAALPKYITTDPRVIKLTEVTEMLEAYVQNNAELEKKVEGFGLSIWVGGFATLCLGAAVIIQVAQFTRAWW